jgi:hypothetical protein
MCVVNEQDWDNSQLRQRTIVHSTFRKRLTRSWRALPRREHSGDHLPQFEEGYWGEAVREFGPRRGLWRSLT